MQKYPEWRLVCFDGRIESYFLDGSIIQKSSDIITYYSVKGNKIRISSQTINHNKQIRDKLTEVANMMSKYEDDYFVALPIDVEANPIQGQHNFFKKYKIQQFFWESATVRQTSQGYQVISDDGNAKVTLAKDLYRILVKYPQRTGARKLTEDGLYLNNKNRRRQLIQKYGGQYIQFPESMINIEIEHEYIHCSKYFTMFDLPGRWCPAMKIIWGYLLSNEIISHPFCYIDFEDPDNKVLRDIKSTAMPKTRALVSYTESISTEQKAIPLYGKPNHNFKWKWSYVQTGSISLFGLYVEGGDCMIHDGCGFWFFQDSTAFYKTKNKDSYDYKYQLAAFPIVVRFQNQPDRDIKSHVMACLNYKNHRKTVQYQSKGQLNTPSHSEQLIWEENIPDVGSFKAFGSKIVVANFEDKTLMTIRREQIKITAPNGRTLVTSLNGRHPKEFRQHLKWLIDWYERVFHPNEWKNRQTSLQELERHIRETETFLEVTKHCRRRN